MLPKILFCLLIAISQNVYSQNVLVPFRVGNLYGLSDWNGNLKLQPKYDVLTIKKHMPVGYFVGSNGQKNSLLFGTKEIISNSDYNEFKVFRNKFISAFRTGLSYDFEQTLSNSKEDQNKRSYQSLFSISGVNVYPANFKNFDIIDTLEWSLKNKKQFRYAIFVSKNFENKCSLFAYDCDEQRISQWICKDYYRIGETGRSNGKRIIMVQENKWDAETEYTIKFINNNFTLELKSKTKGRYGSPYNRNEGVDMPFGGIGESLAAESSHDNEIQAKFEWLNNEMVFFLTPNSNSNIERSKTKITLPIKADTMEIFDYYYRSNNEKSGNQLVLLNFIRYKIANKYGLVFTDSILTKPFYDSVLHLQIGGRQYEEHYFLVGIKDPATGKLKYGTIDANGKEVIPIIYESIDFGEVRKYSISQMIYYKKWKVKKDGQYGFISVQGKELLATKYDTIYESKLRYQHFSDRCIILKKGEQYGALLNWYSDNPIISEPFSTKKIGYYIEDYQGQKGLMLLGLVNDNGSYFCLAKTNGFLFYKE